MSIYDQPSPPAPLEQPTEARPKPTEKSVPEKRRRGCLGCGSCMLGCLGVTIASALFIGIGVWFVTKSLPGWSRDALTKIVEESTLPDDEKVAIVGQIDRVASGYEDGTIGVDQLGKIAEEFKKSPLLSITLAGAAGEKYVKPSGLSDIEKLTAISALQRTAFGVQEGRILGDDVQPVLDDISIKDASDQRQLRESISDEDLRAMITECQRLANAAKIPQVVLNKKISEEIEQVIDRALSSSEQGSVKLYQ